MLFTSPVFSQASGSIAGLTFTHGRGGMVVKSRGLPTNPNTARQRIIRHAFATLGSYWGQTLTQTERDAWALYADNVAWTNKLGQTIFLTGQQHFTRCNVPRIQGGITLLDDAPTIFDLGTFTAPTITNLWSNFNHINIGFEQTDDWVSTVGGFMLVYCGRPTSPGEAFFRGPYRLAGVLPGADPAPGTPVTFNAPWPFNADNIVWIMCRIMQVDGRLSLPIILGPETIVFGP